MSQNFLRPNDVDYDEDEDEEELDGLSDEEGGLQVDDIYIPPPAKPACSTESTGPRLIITKIINEFFKSYGRKEVVGPFHHRMNAIIGPNGSGKSNIIDSILFVLGYRASKIRCKKLSVLIHNSEKFMNVEACTVAVHFALIEDIDDNNFRVVPGSEFVISRTAHLDNTSFYSLNGKRVQFKDVARLLKQHGVDLDHNRFLILQGEVEQISLMKPKAQNEHETGMLEYLEDVIGTTRYKEPLKKLEDRVESLTEQRMEKLNRVRISQKTLEELKGPMQEAVEHLKMENAVAEMKNVLYQSYILDLKGQLQEKETARDDLLATQNEANEKLKAIGDEIKASDAELKKEMKSYEKVEEKKNTISAAFNVASNRDSQLQADMTETNKKRKKTKELLAEEQKKLLKLERAPEENQRTIVECEKKIEQMSVKKEKLEQERLAVTATIRADTQHLQDRKDKLLTDLLKLNEAVVTTKSAFNLAETELQMCLESQRSEQTKLENLQHEQQQSQNLQSERTIAVDELKAQIPAKERALADARRELAGIKSREGDLVDDLRRKRMRLEESRSSMQATSSRGRVLDALMKMKREGKCPGLFGRLGDLGAIDKKYDVAVSTACGPLDNIVVDTVETAQWCIEHLKKYNIGVATFIALKNQEHLRQQASAQLSTPENAPRLFDLIQIEDERVRPAFYYALRNTLVADDLDQACRIAYGSERYRVVTLKGELIETSGTMSGGGRTVSRGRMGQSVATSTVSEADLETMARELNELEDIIRGMRTRQNELETLINQLEPEVREMKMNCDKYARELEALKQHLPRLSHHIKEQERKCKETKADPRQVQRMEAVVKERREESERAEEAASGLQNQVEELTREIEEKSIGKLKKLDKELRETTNIIDKCKKEVTRLNVATKTSERNVRISKEKIESFEQEIAKCESDLIAMKEERATIENEAKILLTCIEELTVELANKEEGYSHIKQKIDKLKKEENKMKMDKVELDEKVKKIVGATKEIQMNIERWKSKIKQLTLHEIPDSEVPQLTVLTDDELRSRDVQQMELELHSLEEQLKTSKPAFTAIAKYKRQQEDFVAKSRDLDQISEKKKQMQDLYDSVKNKRKDEFLKGYNIIRLKLKEMYQTITLGGDANFELVDSFDPFNEGVQFNVRPPKKSWKIISNLSGGEKTLSSLALVFALHYYKPSPFYIMDEIDAALDFKNVSIIANFIKERTKNAQFVIISLRDNMFSLGDILIGVYKVYNCTQTVAINPSEYDNETNNEQRNGIEERTNDTNYQQQSPQLNIVPT